MQKQNEQVLDLFDQADNLTSRMFPAFERKETDCVGSPIKFLQYERPAEIFWHYVVEGFLKSGAAEEQIVEILQNKGIRKCLDKEKLTEAFELLARLFLSELELK